MTIQSVQIVTLESWTGHNDKILAAEKDTEPAQNNPFVCTWLSGPLLSSLCSGQQLDVPVTMYQIRPWTTIPFYNARGPLYFSNPCSSTKHQVSDSPQFHGGLQAKYCAAVIRGQRRGKVGELVSGSVI